MKHAIWITMASLAASGPAILHASELVYNPTNPAFGGAPSYGSYYLSSAQAQDDTKDPDARDPLAALNRDPLSNFEETLERQILTQIARRIVNEAFGDADGVGDGGIYIAGDFSIEIITTNPDALVLEVTDLNTGDITYIEVPYF